ncbi:hypothetical protein P1X14_12185 [Sphingomonas sp. AOB5]|uniref:hypothetical protein n=1 Tax=Sphingomonas sp. AOB5 TaxID=3034017 RepID=UPI0023F95463|nr:hypothetical protein [Sphingomonas sp. AOB5]MDF7776008.1 hypothetical protein [Sphingomonas sp. AOB5]
MPMLAALLMMASDDAATLREAIVSRCDIAPERLAIEQMDGQAEAVLALKGSAPLNDMQLDCFGKEIAGAQTVGFTIEDDAISRRYSTLAATRALDSLGRSAPLPVFDRGRESVAAYAVRLERLCGVAPRSTLRAVRGNIEVIPSAIDRKGRAFLRVHCTITTASAAGFSPFGTVPEVPLHIEVR